MSNLKNYDPRNESAETLKNESAENGGGTLDDEYNECDFPPRYG